jgi:hypothetical protein
VERSRRQNFESIKTVIGNVNLRTTCLAQLLSKDLLVNCVVLASPNSQ